MSRHAPQAVFLSRPQFAIPPTQCAAVIHLQKGLAVNANRHGTIGILSTVVLTWFGANLALSSVKVSL